MSMSVSSLWYFRHKYNEITKDKDKPQDILGCVIVGRSLHLRNTRPMSLTRNTVTTLIKLLEGTNIRFTTKFIKGKILNYYGEKRCQSTKRRHLKPQLSKSERQGRYPKRQLYKVQLKVYLLWQTNIKHRFTLHHWTFQSLLRRTRPGKGWNRC